MTDAPAPPRFRRRWRIAIFCLLVIVLWPGWRADLERVRHTTLLSEVRLADPGRVFGVAIEGENGAQWHAQYAGSAVATLLHDAGLRGSLPSLVAPDFAAHIPSGAQLADGYFRVVSRTNWPWWLPGGGVAWSEPGAR